MSEVVKPRQPTIVQNGALFAAHHRARARDGFKPVSETLDSSLRTSVGNFLFCSTAAGCRLDFAIGKLRQVLGIFETKGAALRALEAGRTGFRTWDEMDRRRAAGELNTPRRWNRKESVT